MDSFFLEAFWSHLKFICKRKLLCMEFKQLGRVWLLI